MSFWGSTAGLLPYIASLSCLCHLCLFNIVAVHQLLRQKQLDRDELEKREQLKQFQKGREHVEVNGFSTVYIFYKPTPLFSSKFLYWYGLLIYGIFIYKLGT